MKAMLFLGVICFVCSITLLVKHYGNQIGQKIKNFFDFTEISLDEKGREL